ncbi:hypothetical protein OPV22_033351 [Ensete ventricosum]|uniref:poly(A)-specific ribonuclease n=1 Tax=Ensete ventricosum TaxID=4639 RepID=A0AAV8PZX1_ENSVE|nr:hypothetical protein OPV22_033351 [Ensete ventricosum]
MSKGDDASTVEIRDVWANNLEAEFAVIREIVDDFPFVAMDTEFPGVAVRPLGDFKTVADQNYHILRANVDLLHLIQLGLTFSDADGNLPTSSAAGGRPVVWQFNFREFDVDRDVSNPDSIDLLIKSGIDLVRNREYGVDAIRFAELLMSSGVVLNDSVSWVTFHCAYDFGYLLKLLTCRRLPDTREGFFVLVRTFFPVVYDIKHLLKFSNSLHGGLNKVAEQLEVERVGICHQAGSDSLLTARAFRKLMASYFDGSIERPPPPSPVATAFGTTKIPLAAGPVDQPTSNHAALGETKLRSNRLQEHLQDEVKILTRKMTWLLGQSSLACKGRCYGYTGSFFGQLV